MYIKKKLFIWKFDRAIYDALYKSYKYLTPELFNDGDVTENIFAAHKEDLKNYQAEKKQIIKFQFNIRTNKLHWSNWW